MGIVGHAASMPEEVPELYQLIAVRGNDRESFLQGQLTQDIAGLHDRGALLGAWCNAKGRVFVVVRLIAMPEAIGIAIPGEMTDAVMKRLEMYRLRADVQFDIDAAWSSVAVRGSRSADDRSTAIVFDGDPPLTEVFGPRDHLAGLPGGLDAAAWQAGLVAAAVPTIAAATTERFTPHMLNLDKLGAVSFSKGCYTGQEIVARTENLGQSRRRLMRYRSTAVDVPPGTKLADGGTDVGEVVVSAGPELLAVTPWDLHARTLTLGTDRVEPLGLPYPFDEAPG